MTGDVEGGEWGPVCSELKAGSKITEGRRSQGKDRTDGQKSG